MKKNTEDRSILLFDGDCNFCNASVNFIIRNNKNRDFIFVPMKSSLGKETLKYFNIRKNYSESIVVIGEEEIYFKSNAALHIAKRLDGILGWLFVFRIVPLSVRDSVYDWIASHRHSWWGKQNNCMVPDPHLKTLFREV